MRLSIKYFIAPILLTLSACAGIEQDRESSMGYLAAPSFDVDLSLDTFVQTKAAPLLPTLQTPALSDVTFKVTDKNNAVVWNQKGIWTGPLKMPVGAYTIEATYGSNTYNEPWYSGTFTGNIEPVKESSPQITLSLKNAVLAIGLSSDLKQHFIPSQTNPLKLSSTSGNLTTSAENYIFVPVGESISVTLEGASSAGVAKTLTYNVNALAAGTATFIKCGMTTVNAPSITMENIHPEDVWGNNVYVGAIFQNISPENQAKVKYYASDDNWATQVETSDKIITGLKVGTTYQIRAGIGALMSTNVASVTIGQSTAANGISSNNQAVHTTTNNELDGTDFTSSFQVAQKFMSELISVKLELCQNDATVLREFTGTPCEAPTSSVQWTSDGSTDALWPYLPTGASQKYTINGYATLKSGKTILLEAQHLLVPAPTINIGIDAKTTYDMYLERNIERANSSNAETIYDIRITGISEALKKHSEYGFSAPMMVDGKTPVQDGDVLSGQSWGAHTITTTPVFDRIVFRQQTKTCHITGLPYTANPPTNTGEHPWIDEWGCTFKNQQSNDIYDRRIQLGGWKSASDCHAKILFEIPSDINITVGAFIEAYKAETNFDTYINISDIQAMKVSTGGKWYKKYQLDNNANPANATLKAANPKVTAGATYGAGANEGSLFNITLKYR